MSLGQRTLNQINQDNDFYNKLNKEAPRTQSEMSWKKYQTDEKARLQNQYQKNDFKRKMLESLDHIASKGFMRETDLDLFVTVSSIEEVPAALKNAPNEKFDPTTKWI